MFCLLTLLKQKNEEKDLDEFCFNSVQIVNQFEQQKLDTSIMTQFFRSIDFFHQNLKISLNNITINHSLNQISSLRPLCVTPLSVT